MATFTAATGGGAFDIGQFNLARLDSAVIVSASNVLIRGVIGINQFLELTGNFTYDGNGDLIGGTLTGFSETWNGTTQWSFSGLSMDIGTFAFYYANYDNNGFLNAALAGADTMTGSAFNDFLLGFGGVDTINGGDGNDYIDGGAGADVLNGGNGNDSYLYDGLDTINDTGATSSSADLVASVVSVNLGAMTGVENALLIGSALNATGSAVGNILTGNSLANSLNGLGGDDTLYGLIGNDALDGGTGDDEMFGGFGNDTYNIDSVNDVASEDYINILWRNKLTGENYVWSMDDRNYVSGGYLDVSHVPWDGTWSVWRTSTATGRATSCGATTRRGRTISGT